MQSINAWLTPSKTNKVLEDCASIDHSLKLTPNVEETIRRVREISKIELTQNHGLFDRLHTYWKWLGEQIHAPVLTPPELTTFVSYVLPHKAELDNASTAPINDFTSSCITHLLNKSYEHGYNNFELCLEDVQLPNLCEDFHGQKESNKQLRVTIYGNLHAGFNAASNAKITVHGDVYDSFLLSRNMDITVFGSVFGISFIGSGCNNLHIEGNINDFSYTGVANSKLRIKGEDRRRNA